jgi:NTE family protein
MALCLSGGGYRAMLFHAGALWRLHELGLLEGLKRISAVSGGAIAMAGLAVGIEALREGASFADAVVAPLRRLAGRSLDVRAVLLGLALPGAVNARLAGAYRRHLVGSRTLADLPDAPDLVFNATSLQSARLWLFSRRQVTEFGIVQDKNPTLPLAAVVAASSAFPPFLSPARPRLRGGLRPVLSDGGVYDNLGLEAAFKRFTTILVSDAGAQIPAMARPSPFWPLAMLRVTHVIDNQVRELRKAQLLEAYRDEDRAGAYWSIRSDLAHFKVSEPLPADPAAGRLATVPTRLGALPGELQERLINWGYATADAALRAHLELDGSLPAPAYPYPAAV